MGGLFSKQQAGSEAAGEDHEHNKAEPLTSSEAVGVKRPADREASTPADGASASDDARQPASSPDEPNALRKRARTDGEEHEVRQALDVKLQAAVPQHSTPLAQEAPVAGGNAEAEPGGHAEGTGGQADSAVNEPADAQQPKPQQQPQQAQSQEQERPPEPEEDQDQAPGQAQADEEEAGVADLEQQPVPVMSFGQYAGRPLTHLPASYVCWICQQHRFFDYQAVRRALRQQLLALQLIRPAPEGSRPPFSHQTYASGYQPVWRVAPATPQEEQAAQAAVMGFSRHVNTPLTDLPSDFIEWMCKEPSFWNLDQPRKRELLRHLEVLGRVRYTEEGRVVPTEAELQ